VSVRLIECNQCSNMTDQAIDTFLKAHFICYVTCVKVVDATYYICVETNLEALLRAKMELGLYKYVVEILIPNPSAHKHPITI
jgi:hypothetical protein